MPSIRSSVSRVYNLTKYNRGVGIEVEGGRRDKYRSSGSSRRSRNSGSNRSSYRSSSNSWYYRGSRGGSYTSSSTGEIYIYYGSGTTIGAGYINIRDIYNRRKI